MAAAAVWPDNPRLSACREELEAAVPAPATSEPPPPGLGVFQPILPRRWEYPDKEEEETPAEPGGQPNTEEAAAAVVLIRGGPAPEEAEVYMAHPAAAAADLSQPQAQAQQIPEEREDYRSHLLQPQGHLAAERTATRGKERRLMETPS